MKEVNRYPKTTIIFAKVVLVFSPLILLSTLTSSKFNTQCDEFVSYYPTIKASDVQLIVFTISTHDGKSPCFGSMIPKTR